VILKTFTLEEFDRQHLVAKLTGVLAQTTEYYPAHRQEQAYYANMAPGVYSQRQPGKVDEEDFLPQAS
jgi:hypothetical protein